MGAYIQDTWKISRKLTLDYGIRWDLQKPQRELNARTSGFSASVLNPNANGLPGGVIYEGSGAGRCNCDLVATYPYAVAPRLGVAYQLTPKTVLRGGWGIVYGPSNIFAYIGGGNSQGMGFNTINFTSPGNGVEAGTLASGLAWNPSDLSRPVTIPACWLRPAPPCRARLMSSIRTAGVRRAFSHGASRCNGKSTKDLVAEVSYVGNRASWLTRTTW